MPPPSRPLLLETVYSLLGYAPTKFAITRTGLRLLLQGEGLLGLPCPPTGLTKLVFVYVYQIRKSTVSVVDGLPRYDGDGQVIGWAYVSPIFFWNADTKYVLMRIPFPLHTFRVHIITVQWLNQNNIQTYIAASFSELLRRGFSGSTFAEPRPNG